MLKFKKHKKKKDHSKDAFLLFKIKEIEWLINEGNCQELKKALIDKYTSFLLFKNKKGKDFY